MWCCRLPRRATGSPMACSCPPILRRRSAASNARSPKWSVRRRSNAICTRPSKAVASPSCRWPQCSPAWTVQRICASGMQAIDSAFHDCAAGRADLVLAGGVESMSRAPVLLSEAMVTWLAHWNAARGVGARARTLTKLRPAYLAPVIGLLRGLTDPLVGLNMGQTAENLAYRFGISREEMDAYALEGHRRLAAALDQGRLGEIEFIYDNAGKVYGEDDGLRRDGDMGKLAKLKPVFDKKFGKVTAGNSEQITDGE